MASARHSCPCQHITLLPSPPPPNTATCPNSLTAYTKNEAMNRINLPLSNGGITPLHLAAQHDHPAAVSLLLSKRQCNIDTGLTNDASPSMFCGATPLHQAAFSGSGAISSMRILLDWGRDSPLEQTDILAKDESFRDMRTTLYKSAVDGRPLAFQLLLMALREQNLLLGGLATVDSQGLTPLGLVKQFTSLNEEDLEIKKSSARRWDGIAGRCANWESCQQLLEGAVTYTEQGHLMESSVTPTSGRVCTKSSLPIRTLTTIAMFRCRILTTTSWHVGLTGRDEASRRARYQLRGSIG